MLTSLTAGTMLWRQGSRPARYCMIAFTLLAVGAILYYLRLVGLVPANPVTEYFLQIGSAVQVLLLSFGLADQMNALRTAKLEAEQEARSAQTALNTELERLVHQRTLELEDANKRLTEMAIVDDLTKSFNRRYFNTCFGAALSRCHRHGVPLAFCIIDVDNFKLYNDSYGHQAGDVVLQEISGAIRGRLRRAGDRFFRLGGEEFGILLDAQEPVDDILSFVESLRLAIESLKIPHEGNTGEIVTASFGLVIVPSSAPEARVEDVYALADKLLYDAKHAGRNRMMWQMCELPEVRAKRR
jgi:diguanylate cyclase (GGDEF)-like protein